MIVGPSFRFSLSLQPDMDRYQQVTCLILIVLTTLYSSSSASRTDNATLIMKTKRKALSVFNVVRFPNDVCGSSSGGKNGTCYTASECESKKGVSSGTCANSYGVCCIFTLGCGGVSSENCTYFDSPATSGVGQCIATICKLNQDICSLRIDFQNFVITGPNTVVGVTTVSIVGGSIGTGGKAASDRTRCLTDFFSVTGNGGGAPPFICGTNSNQHIYVDASDSCNRLAFQLGSTGIGSAIANRAWSLKVSQISCTNPNLPPPGCTQYFFGSTTGSVQTFNFGSATTNLHLASQYQQICFRRERGTCRICYTTLTGAANDFAVSAKSNKATMGFMGTDCCGYGADGLASEKGFDCVLIPGATKQANKAQLGNALCGNRLTSISSGASKVTTICSMQTPFQLTFISDPFEFKMEVGNRGFRLFYSLTC